MTKKITKLMLNWQEYEIREYQQGWGIQYTIDNIPTDDSNVYVNVWQTWKTIQSVKFSFTFAASTSKWVYVSISSNGSSSDRYGVSQPEAESIFYIRWRLNWASDTQYRNIPWFVNNSTNTVVFTINRDGNCNITCNWTSTNYTAWTAELNVIQTIMNLSDMNVYGSQNTASISWNKIDVEVEYQSSEPQTEPCHVCWGTGEEECIMCSWTWQEMCPTCAWAWQIWDPEDPESRTTCPDCDGGGFISCWICDWTWMVTCSNCGWTWEEPWE